MRCSAPMRVVKREVWSSWFFSFLTGGRAERSESEAESRAAAVGLLHGRPVTTGRECVERFCSSRWIPAGWASDEGARAPGTANQLLFGQPRKGAPQMSYETGSRGWTAPHLTHEQAPRG